jgi:Family of unknown function (DUF5856)
MQHVFQTLFAARDAAHKLHLSTKSFAKHIALDELYKGLQKLTDEIIETWQGKHGQLVAEPGSDDVFMRLFTGPQMNEAAFVSQLAQWVDSSRKTFSPDDGFLLNLWDELGALVYRAKFKIDNLH